MTFLDKTFCASPNCMNVCGRKMNEEQRKLYPTALKISPFINLSFAYFCGEPLKENTYNLQSDGV